MPNTFPRIKFLATLNPIRKYNFKNRWSQNDNNFWPEMYGSVFYGRRRRLISKFEQILNSDKISVSVKHHTSF